MLRLIALAALLATPANLARAQEPPQDPQGVEAVVVHHFKAFQARDWESLLSDYADDIVYVGHGGIVQGIAAYREKVAKTAAQPGPIYQVKQILVQGDVGRLDWIANPGRPNEASGKDVFVVRGGKIKFQTTIEGPASPFAGR